MNHQPRSITRAKPQLGGSWSQERTLNAVFCCVRELPLAMVGKRTLAQSGVESMRDIHSSARLSARRARLRAHGLLVGLALCAVPALLSAAPVAVSPVADSGLALVEARCPTFSWTSVANRDGYELVVYGVGRGSEAVVDSQPAIRVQVPSAANSWTPSLERCLRVGERYAWSIRPLSSDAEEAWSVPSFFEIATPDVAVQLAGATGQAAADSSAPAAGVAAPGADLRAPGSDPQQVAPEGRPAVLSNKGSTTFEVDGLGNLNANSVTANTFSGDGSGLTSVVAQITTALAANGSNCPEGQSPVGIDAAGNAEGCVDISTQAELDAHSSSGAHDARYLQLDGGTLTGPLLAPSFEGDGSALTGIVAATASSLAANGANCAPGTAPTGVTAAGAAEDCFDVTTGDEFINHLIGGDHDGRYLRLAGGTMSGDLTAPNFIGNGAGLTNVAAVTATQASNATTANALSANPANCGAGSAFLGVAANGTAEGCFDVATQAELNSHRSAGNGDHDTRYLRQTGGTLTGSLTVNANLKVNGVVEADCPSGTQRVGTWCIESTSRGPSDYSESLFRCHVNGMSLCPLEAIMTCDDVEPSQTGGSCGVVTDVNLTVRTSSVDLGSGSVYSRMIGFNGGGNTISVLDRDTPYIYYCCRALMGAIP